MLNKLKQIVFTKKGAYISLAVCMLLIGCIGIYASVRNMSKVIEESDFEYESSITPITLEKLPADPPEINETDAPAVNAEPVVPDFIKPLEGEISKTFSGEELVYSETMNDYRTHVGVDIISDENATVYSAEEGRIIDVDRHPLWGTCVTVEHGNDYTTCYRNLSDILPEGIEVGSYVSKGGVIGAVGSSALVEIGESAHLHFEMYVNGEPVDPIEYMS